MGKKDSKKKTAERKERVAAKQSKKADKKEKKNKVKGRDVDSDAEDVDLDAVLAAYAEEQAKFLKVTEETSGPPTPRSSSTIVASPSNRNELLVFGGENFDGTLATFFNNLYIYLIDRGEWREVTSPNSPLPRSGHAWCRGGNAGGVYLFGGEFSSPKQGTFYHYNDFWHLDPTSREWSRIESKKGPPARSGHRMTYYKVRPFFNTNFRGLVLTWT
jgi:N-acetylneuraminic acid mutarotase